MWELGRTNSAGVEAWLLDPCSKSAHPACDKGVEAWLLGPFNRVHPACDKGVVAWSLDPCYSLKAVSSVAVVKEGLLADACPNHVSELCNRSFIMASCCL